MERRSFVKKSLAAGTLLTVPLPISTRLFASQLPTSITAFSALDLSRAIRTKQVSCMEVMQTYLERIHRYNPTYNALVGMVPDDLLTQQAREADAALARGEYWGWMHGMPHAVKDLAAVQGLPFTQGSPIFADRIAEEDSPMVARIRQQGAIFIGKTNTPEFGFGSQSYNPVYGATGSAYNPKLTSGGSSGGAACGLATHMLPVADGSDMMGSLRNPGAFNNVIGFRPSTHVVMDPDPEYDRLLYTSGPMGRNTADAIQLLQTLALVPEYDGLEPLDLGEVRIGWMGNLDQYLQMEPGILELCEASLSVLETAGARVSPMLPTFNLSDLWQSWNILRQHESLYLLELYENPETRKQLKPEAAWEIQNGLRRTAAEVAWATGIRNAWYGELDRMFEAVDFLMLPTAQVFPFPKENHWPKEINGRPMDTYHRWMEVVIPGSMGGLPVANVPVGFDAQGRPMGMQVMGRYGADKRVLRFALAYEQHTDHLQTRPILTE